MEIPKNEKKHKKLNKLNEEKKIVFSSFLSPVDQLAYSQEYVQHTLETAGLKNEKKYQSRLY